jgi:hypothetical protein
MGFMANVEPLGGKLPQIAFRWDPETEILSGQFKAARKESGLTGSLELAGADGSFVLLDVASGVVRGLEVVVWPEIDVVDGLTPPPPARQGRLAVPARPSQPGIAAVEVETNLSAEKSPDESVYHLRIGLRRKVEVVQLADNLLLDVDATGQIAGFWLLRVPPFPQTAL